MNRQPLSTSQIAPTVKHCHTFPDDYGFTLDSFPKLPLRRTFDYELEIVLSDGGSMLVGDTTYPMRRGAVVFRRPGSCTNALNPYRCQSVILDMASGGPQQTYGIDYYSLPRTIQCDYSNEILDAIPAYTLCEESERLIHVFDRIQIGFKALLPHTPLILRAHVLEVLHILYAHAMRVGSASIRYRYHKSVRQALNLISANYAKPLRVKDIALHVELNADYFSRLFQQCTGVKPHQFILDYRLNKAKDLLIYTRLPVGEIALLCGIESPAYFNLLFRRNFTMTPGEFRKKYS